MTQQDDEAAVAAFIRAKGVTRCPTVCAAPTQAAVGESDRKVLQQRDAQKEARLAEKKLRETALFRFGTAA